MFGENLQDRVLPCRVAAISLEDHSQRGEPVAPLVRKRRTHLGEKAKSFCIQGLARTHDRAGAGARSVFVEPFRAFDLSLQDCTVKGVLKIASAKFGDGLDNFEPA